uniref:Uncharacterized protein n=1 Tax=Rangifer tarandus platyrhynchus TaxID=3082113 RepID=A0ACB0EIF6_RANTA|nr:unnamed protein product [Rangifer tarandus platyrhynchus]
MPLRGLPWWCGVKNRAPGPGTEAPAVAPEGSACHPEMKPGTTAAEPARREPCSRSERRPSGEEPVPAARESPQRATKNKREVNVSKR